MKIGISNISEVLNTDKFKASYHLSEGRLARKLIDNSPFPLEKIEKVTNRIFYGGRAKRIYVENPQKGIPFMSSSDMMKADLDNLKLISKKHTKNLDAFFLKKGWTLISRSGTIGNTAYTNSDFENKAASEHIIRVVPNDTIKAGYLYAYLSSKFGYNLLTQGTFGAVIQHIEPQYIADLPIPLLPEPQQQHIHNLIEKAALLREEANRLLREAKAFFDEKFDKSNIRQDFTQKVSAKEIYSSNRLNGNYFLSKGRYVSDIIKTSTYELLGNIIKEIFTSGREKRVYVEQKNGIPFLGNTDLGAVNPFNSCNYISKLNVNNNSFLLKNMIVTGRVGQNTVGTSYYISDIVAGTVGSDNLIRIVIDETVVSPFYVFVFLITDYGSELIKRLKSGVAQPFINEDMLRSIPIPFLNKNEITKIENLAKEALEKRDKAFTLENQAITELENTITSWQN